ncbi:DUF6979 family protein [Dickeya zeae]|uniref:DUF6979 family protein n=1 Tax=Dickeya zeae TaxID=204042 RepID=UPI0020970164|nr:hypothetical protein [Dickeya zeae]MCO7262242.1 hypothetical protein [Dickeya zeae]
MTKYTDAALITTRSCQGQEKPDVNTEWLKAIRALNAYDESCPRCAYLGLCEEGMVKGIPAGHYGLSATNKNKGYAVDAANLILSGHEPDNKTIWQKVTDKKISDHDQVKIVIALHNAGLLQQSSRLTTC